MSLRHFQQKINTTINRCTIVLNLTLLHLESNVSLPCHYVIMSLCQLRIYCIYCIVCSDCLKSHTPSARGGLGGPKWASSSSVSTASFAGVSSSHTPLLSQGTQYHFLESIMASASMGKSNLAKAVAFTEYTGSTTDTYGAIECIELNIYFGNSLYRCFMSFRINRILPMQPSQLQCDQLRDRRPF